MPAAKRKRNLFDPTATEPFTVSRSGVEEWVSCPRCFFLHRRLGIAQPSLPSMMLNRALDVLLKSEFDLFRAQAKPHPLMERHGVNAVPFCHPELATWRSNFKGIRLLHTPTNLLLGGAPDDLWVTPSGELHLVDYKATASAKDEPQTLETEYRQGYKRQLEFYQFLLRGNGFTVSSKAYIVYAVGRMAAPSLEGKLLFDLQLIEHVGSTEWIAPTILKVKETLMLDAPPPPAPDCENCRFVAAVNAAVSTVA